MGDTEKAVEAVKTYLLMRPGIRSRLYAQVDDGLKAQDLEGTRTTAISYERDEAGEKGPRVTDTTGDTAIRPDRARLLLAELDRAERALILEANILAGHPIVAMCDLLAFLDPLARTAPGRVRSSARVFDRAIAETYGRHRPDPGKSADGEAGCQSCARLKVNGVPWWSPVSYNRGKPTDLGGMLPTKVLLCKSCRDFICRDPDASSLSMPTEIELRQKHDSGKWPKDTEVPHRYSAA